MYTLKTQENDKDVNAFIEGIENKTRKADAIVLLDLFFKVTRENPKMWGDSIIGYGKYTYTNKSKVTAQWLRIGFSPRKQSLSLYLMNGFDNLDDLLSELGKHKLGKGCLYINKLSDIDLKVLEKIIQKSYKDNLKTYPN